ncbi:MAG TPA: helix-turn-helix domain-containing protein [Hanamia sp.]|nr:helix-turn-helix domain-containing protein [Hanamia sp.]
MESAQQIFFKHIKSLLPTHISLVDEIADVLNISNDSAYRRIRGETQISLEEIKKLCQKFKISLDQLLQLNSNSFLFTGTLTNNTDFNYDKWLESCLMVIKNVKTFEPHHMIYLAKEFPFFYYFLIPEIAAFKSFFFMKSILFYDDWKGRKFSVNDDYSKYKEIWNELASTFISIPGTEIWNAENITSTIRQIEFYYTSGVFKSQKDVDCLFEKLLGLIDHIELQAEYGVKLKYNQQPSSNLKENYKIFINELIMGDNMQIFLLGDQYATYLNHSILNYMTTTNVEFNNYMKRNMDMIVQKSIPISKVNEKERMKFFNQLRSRISIAKEKNLVTS